MRDILDQIVKWWDAGETFGLATVVSTYHSAPREPGAAMAVSAEGEVVGSVSGGCVEGAVYELAGEVHASGQAVSQRYGVSDDDAFAVGLTCGGIIDIFVEPVSRELYPELGEIAAAIRAGQPVAVATVIDGPGTIGARRVIWAGADAADADAEQADAEQADADSGERGLSARSAQPGGWMRRSTTTRGACSPRESPAPAATALTASGAGTSCRCSCSPSRRRRGCWCSVRSTSPPRSPGSASSSATGSRSATPARCSRPHPASPRQTR